MTAVCQGRLDLSTASLHAPPLLSFHAHDVTTRTSTVSSRNTERVVEDAEVIAEFFEDM
jgi:hypothetical protein